MNLDQAIEKEAQVFAKRIVQLLQASLLSSIAAPVTVAPKPLRIDSPKPATFRRTAAPAQVARKPPRRPTRGRDEIELVMEEIVKVLEKNGELKSAQISALIGLDAEDTRHPLDLLRKSGRVVTANPGEPFKSHRYRLAAGA